MHIRSAHPSEAETLTALNLRSKAYWGYDAPFMAACRAELTVDAAYLAEHTVFVAEKGVEIVGLYALEHVKAREVELGLLFVEPAYIGQGVGRALIQHAAMTAAQQGYRTLHIQGDPHATRFYEAAGAKRVGERPSASIAGRTLPLFEMPLPTPIIF